MAAWMAIACDGVKQRCGIKSPAYSQHENSCEKELISSADRSINIYNSEVCFIFFDEIFC